MVAITGPLQLCWEHESFEEGVSQPLTRPRLSRPQAGSLQRLKRRQRTLERKRRRKQGVDVPHPQLFPSDSQTCPESVQPGQERGLQAPWPVGGRPDGGCQPLNAQSILGVTGAGSRVSVLVGRGAAMGSPAMMWGPGGPGKAAWVGPVEPYQLHSQKHLSAKALCPGPGGADVARRPEDEGGLALLSCHLSLGVECMGGSWTVCPPIDMEGLDLFLRQSCILILDVFPEAYFS